MENNRIVLGLSAYNIYMQGKYELIDHSFSVVTTLFVQNNIKGMQCDKKIMACVNFSPEEMEECCIFINSLRFKETIAFADGTALFYAKKNALPFMITDRILEKVCDELRIQSISDSEFITTPIIKQSKVSTIFQEEETRNNFTDTNNKLMTG